MSKGIPLTHNRITIPVLQKMKENKEPIVALSIYDSCHARLFDQAGGEVIIVGDSANMVIKGEPNPKSMEMDTMLYHVEAVGNGTKRLFVIGDMPLCSYEPSNEIAILNAGRFMRVGANAVKMEVNMPYIERVEVVSNFCPVVAHIGLNPNKADMLGGYKTQGKTMEGVIELCRVACAAEAAGACMILLESVTEEVSQEIRERAQIPVLGIAAGRKLDGQLLISYDLLDLYEWPGNKKPKHFTTYQAGEAGLTVGSLTLDAYRWYVQAVKSGEFPGEENAHFLPETEREDIERYLRGPE